jgi:polyisoprenoid-binding protein YceI
MMSGMSGTLRLDPARPSEATLQVDIQISGLTVTSEEFGTHLKTGDFFDVTKYRTAHFASRTIEVQGENRHEPHE